MTVKYLHFCPFLFVQQDLEQILQGMICLLSTTVKIESRFQEQRKATRSEGGFLPLLLLVCQISKQLIRGQEVILLIVYNSKIKPVTVFQYSLKYNDIFFERKEAFIRKGITGVLIKYLKFVVDGFSLFKHIVFASMAFYYRLLLFLAGFLLYALGGNFQGKMILYQLNITEPQLRPFGKRKVRIKRISASGI